MRLPPRSALFPYTTLFRSGAAPCLLRIRSRRGRELAARRPELLSGVVVGRSGRGHGTDGGAARAEDPRGPASLGRSEEHTSELQSRRDLVCRLLLEKKNHN